MRVRGKKTPLTPEVTFRPLEKKRYSEQIAEKIQNRILKDHLQIATRLPSEKELALEFQVSRSVIREALRILEMSGLVDIRKGPAGGIFVSQVYHRPITHSLNNMITSGQVTIDHLFDVRLLIEPHIAVEATLHAGEEDLKRLRDLIEDSSRHLHDPSRLKRNNLNFHLLLGKASGNPVLSILLESVFEILVGLSYDFLDLSLEKHFFEVHREIFQIMEKKEPEEVRRLIEQDIQDVREKLKGFKQKTP